LGIKTTNFSVSTKIVANSRAPASEFLDAIENAYKVGNTELALRFSEKIPKPYGGWKFDGFKLEAPAEWKLV